MILPKDTGETTLDTNNVTSVTFSFQGHRYYCLALHEPASAYCVLRDQVIVRHRIVGFYESGGVYTAHMQGTDDSLYVFHFNMDDVLHNIAVVSKALDPLPFVMAA